MASRLLKKHPQDVPRPSDRAGGQRSGRSERVSGAQAGLAGPVTGPLPHAEAGSASSFRSRTRL